MFEFKKIDLPFAMDIIAERFDNILDLIHPNCFVYGGVLRDIVAGLPLEGDLDLVTSSRDYDYCIANISKSGKWRDVRDLIKTITTTTKNGYKGNKNISKISAFETFNNRRVEIMQAESQIPENNLTNSLNVVKSVDIRCCGIAMDIYGNAYEILKGAYQDCLDKVLRLNKLSTNSNIENLKNRIAKLERRGWTSKINIEKAEKTLIKIKEAEKKEFKEKMANVRPFKGNLQINIHSKPDNSVLIEISKIEMSIVNSETIRLFVENAMFMAKIKVNYKLSAKKSYTLGIEILPSGLEDGSKFSNFLNQLVSDLEVYFKNKLHVDTGKWSSGGVIKDESKYKYEDESKYRCKSFSKSYRVEPYKAKINNDVPLPTNIEEATEEPPPADLNTRDQMTIKTTTQHKLFRFAEEVLNTGNSVHQNPSYQQAESTVYDEVCDAAEEEMICDVAEEEMMPEQAEEMWTTKVKITNAPEQVEFFESTPTISRKPKTKRQAKPAPAVVWIP